VEMCRQIGAPLYAYNRILKWGQEAHAKRVHISRDRTEIQCFHE
jgi:hypothetical protein